MVRPSHRAVSNTQRVTRSGERRRTEFSFEIYFQSSVYNSPGANGALWIHAIVRSNRLSAWRATQPHHLLADDSFEAVRLATFEHRITGSTSTLLMPPPDQPPFRLRLQQSKLSVCRCLQHSRTHPPLRAVGYTTDLPGMEMPNSLDFLLCFCTASAADAVLHRFFATRPDLLPQYHADLDRFGRDGFTAIALTGYAPQLAFATIAYQLQSPGNACQDLH